MIECDDNKLNIMTRGEYQRLIITAEGGIGGAVKMVALQRVFSNSVLVFNAGLLASCVLLAHL